jgi:hypothetical protein
MEWCVVCGTPRYKFGTKSLEWYFAALMKAKLLLWHKDRAHVDIVQMVPSGKHSTMNS